MQSVNAPTLDPETVYRSIASARKSSQVRARLAEAQELVLVAYDAYANANTSLCVLKPAVITPASPRDLKTNYDYLIKSAKHFSGEIMANNRGGRCPSCGQGRATTLDHYLPKSVYPEFSVLPLNLVPACVVCNQTKASSYEYGGRGLFLHAYLDEIPGERFLFAKVEVHGSAIVVKFWVDPPRSFGDDLQQRITTHFGKLKLATYYSIEGINEVSERRGSIEDMINDGLGPPEIALALRRDADSVAGSKGVNYWRYSLLDAMAESEEICSGAFCK